MFDAPYALALTAGLLAAVNPCGFALLPAYLSLLVVGDRVDDSGTGRLAAVGRALALTAAMTVGFVGVFGVFGLLAAPAADAVARNLPWLSVIIGLILAGLGAWLLAGRELPALTPKLGRGPAVTGRFWSMVAFGASYAVASLGCTVGPFLALVVSAFGTGSVGAGVGLFVAYAAGMGLVVGTVALAVALAKVSLVRGLRRAAPVIARVGGALLLAAGLYVAWYGWYELRVFSDASTTDPLIDAAGRIQSAISSWLGSFGPGALVIAFAVLLAAVVTVTVLVGLRRAQTGQPDTTTSRTTPATVRPDDANARDDAPIL